MKPGKKAATLLAFVVGACVFVSTAFADMALGTGYDRLKNAIKHTAAQMEHNLPNYTVEMLVTLKTDNQTIRESSEVEKIDTVRKASERTSVSRDHAGNTYTNYWYSDAEMSISKYGNEDVYYVQEYPGGRGSHWNAFSNPFEEEGAQEIEKIIDALVGNLKDYVQVEETAQGGKMYSGSLGSAQVPTLVNAITSFVMKQIIREQSNFDQEPKLPEIESDIYVSKVTGAASENPEGLLESLRGEVVLTGKDKDGVSHDITVSLMFKLTDIGATKVEKPDLTNAKVERYTSPKISLDSKHVGVYKNNIVIEENGKFVKIGERTLEITAVEYDRVIGRFYETVKPEYADKYPDPLNIEFVSDPEYSSYVPVFFYTNARGEREAGQLHPGGIGKVYVEIGMEVGKDGEIRGYKGKPDYDGEMIRVFEE
mgnify:CR=1 FL=1